MVAVPEVRRSQRFGLATRVGRPAVPVGGCPAVALDSFCNGFLVRTRVPIATVRVAGGGVASS